MDRERGRWSDWEILLMKSRVGTPRATFLGVMGWIEASGLGFSPSLRPSIPHPLPGLRYSG